MGEAPANVQCMYQLVRQVAGDVILGSLIREVVLTDVHTAVLGVEEGLGRHAAANAFHQRRPATTAAVLAESPQQHSHARVFGEALSKKPITTRMEVGHLSEKGLWRCALEYFN